MTCGCLFASLHEFMMTRSLSTTRVLAMVYSCQSVVMHVRWGSGHAVWCRAAMGSPSKGYDLGLHERTLQ